MYVSHSGWSASHMDLIRYDWIRLGSTLTEDSPPPLSSNSARYAAFCSSGPPLYILCALVRTPVRIRPSGSHCQPYTIFLHRLVLRREDEYSTVVPCVAPTVQVRIPCLPANEGAMSEKLICCARPAAIQLESGAVPEVRQTPHRVRSVIFLATLLGK